MVDKLIGAIAQKIRDTFGDSTRVYTENVYQNAVKPCFFVECGSSERIELLNRRFFVRAHVEIRYENDGDEKRLEAESITALMFDLLNLIYVQDKCFNGRKINAKWENGRLVVRAIYDMWPELDRTGCEVMETIEVKGLYYGSEIYEG